MTKGVGIVSFAIFSDECINKFHTEFVLFYSCSFHSNSTSSELDE